MQQNSNQRSLLPGRVLSITGLFLAVIGAFFVSVAMNGLGMILGMLGYALGSRILGSVASWLSLITIFIGMFFGQDTSQF
jgi:hypothetical protein